MVQLRRLMVRLVAIAALSLCLSGCVDYQLGINFDSQTHGTLVQTLHLNDQFVSLNSDVRQQWLQVFIQEAKTFSGKATSLDDGTLEVKIDFNNGADLVKKFNQLFAADGPMTQVPGAPPLLAHINLDQKNYGVALRNHLQAEIDLRGLSTDRAIGDGGALDDWRTLSLSFDIAAIADSSHWTLTPGELNTVDAAFWIPSPIGIGAAIIFLLCAGGYGVRHGLGK